MVTGAKGSRARHEVEKYYDALDVRSPAERERALLAALPRQIAHAKTHAPAMAEILAAVSPHQVTSRAALAALPVLRKHEGFMSRQSQRTPVDPFAGFAAVRWHGVSVRSGVRRVFQSPGPLYEPEGHGGDFERSARAMFAAGFQPGDLVHNSFSYHLTPAGAIMEAGAMALGCSVFPGGTGNTDLQLRAILDLQPACYVGTPSFLKVLFERAAAQGATRLPFTKALVSGEAFPTVARDWLRERGVDAYQCYMTSDVGLIAYETAPREGLVLDEGIIVEIVRPGTGDPVPEGEVGEVVVTSLNPDYPLIRFGTGDLSAVLPGPCASGRTNVRIRGWLGRANQTTKVRGMFVGPEQIAEVARRHRELLRLRLVIGGSSTTTWEPDAMCLRAECASASDELGSSIARTVRELTKLRCEVEFVGPGTLPNDGLVIEDLRAPV
ncbi:phenylacetate--CoA ligase family protein [Variovorax sp. ZT4R33]|uniref:phenylacetate--CoA ligase family protein n=1 Tax=Variovorax sp. ZT4R33 TaxID=3443743 RepID=UPI003F47DF04